MSENTEYLQQRAQIARETINEWFDKHPKPWEIDCHLFMFDNLEIEIYFADQVFDWYQIRIKCQTAQRANYLNKLLYKTTCQMGIDLVWKNKELFLLRFGF